MTRRSSASTALLFTLSALIGLDAQSTPEPGITPSVAISTVPIYPAQYDGDVRALPPLLAPRSYWLLNEFEGPPDRKPPFVPGQDRSQPYAPLAAMPAPLVNFSGLSYNTQLNGTFVGTGFPPDTNGDAGIGYYIQSVNAAFGIFEKATGALVAGFTEDQLWSSAGTGTRCDADNRGDPVVLFDAAAQRWILTNFAFTFDGFGRPVGPFYQCIAVSKTSDPVAGGYWLYAVRMDTGVNGAPPVGSLNDYGKFGIWTDCLYMGANEFNTTTAQYYPPYVGAMFAAFDRNILYSGTPLTGSNSSIGFLASTTDFYTMIPANLLGPDADSLPPAGTPEYFVVESASESNFEVRKFVRGATACGAGSSLGPATNVSQSGYTFPQTVPQPGTSTQLDSLGDRIMNKVQYRRIGSAESLWVVHTTANATAIAQPQWAQINVTGGTVSTTPVQQQIYAPDVTLHRWMPSIATDRFGNVAIGYSTSSSAAFPGIAYSGRLAGDPLNQLSQSETALISGGGSQSIDCQGPCSRWGDYSSMSVDPEDDCTFWYTSEYYDTQASGNSGDWHTRIGAFKFVGCTSRSTQAVQFTSIAPLGVVVGDSAHVITATASSGLPVKLTVDTASTSVCALSGAGTGSKVSYLGPGTCTIDANQFGDNTYRAAPQVQQTFGVAAIFRNGFEAQ